MNDPEAKHPTPNSPNVNYLRDFIYGGIDGAVTTFAVVAGVAGASLSSTVIIIMGLANLVADGFSMAASNYSGTKSEIDDYHRLREMRLREIREHPEAVRMRTSQLLAAKGLSGETLQSASAAIANRTDRWVEFLMTEEHGQPMVRRDPLKSAFATFIAFAICGLVPLIPFFIDLGEPFMTGIIMTGIVFFLIGAAKSHWSTANWWRSGLETFLIGMAAALLAYLAGYGLKELIDPTIG